MDTMFLILILVSLMVVILGVLAILFIKHNEGKHKVDYYSLFIMGLIWLVIGIPLRNTILEVFGIAFFVLGLFNKKKWKKNRTDWTKVTKKQKKILYLSMIMLFLLLVAGIIVFCLPIAGIL